MVRLFRVFIPVTVVLLLISEILLISAAFFLATFLIPELDRIEYFSEGNGVINVVLVLVTIIIGLYLHDLYSEIHVKSHITLLQQLCFVLGAAFLVQALVSYIDRNLRMPLHVMVPGSALALGELYVWRLFFSSSVLRVVGADRLLLVGGSPVLTEVAQHILKHPEKAVRIIGQVTDDGEAADGVKYLGRMDSLREVRSEEHT